MPVGKLHWGDTVKPGTILLAALALSACTGVGFVGWRHLKGCTPKFDERYSYLPTGGPREFRTYVIPGMEGSAKSFLSEDAPRAWMAGLTKLGSDVVILNTPIPKACWFADGGYNYRKAFLAELSRVMIDANQRHGHTPKTIIAGVSYGGLHAIVAYASNPKMFVGWEASMPVTRIGALEELKSVGDLPGFNAFAEIPRLANSRGFMSWGTVDYRVDHRLDEALYAAIQSPTIVGVSYPGVAHQTTPIAVNNLLANARLQAYGPQSP